MKAKRRNLWVLGFAVIFFIIITLLHFSDLSSFSNRPKHLIIIYDISLALFTGCVVFLLTISLPEYFFLKKIKKFLNDEFVSFNKYINARLKRLKIDPDLNMTEEEIKMNINSIKYGDVVNQETTVYDTLHEIRNRTQRFYQSVLPYAIQLDSADLMKPIRDLKDHDLFCNRRLFITKELSQINDRNVEIGGIFNNYLKDLKKLQSKIK